MARAQSSIERFLARNRLHPSGIDLRGCCDAFLEEMTRGLEGRPSSLPMIATYIETARAVPRGERVVSLDAGGTNMRVAGVSFDGAGAPVIDGLVAASHARRGRCALPGGVLPGAGAMPCVLIFAGRDRIGFCFSYPAEITPQKDGRLIQFTKEIKAQGVEGQLVGAGLCSRSASTRRIRGRAPHGRAQIVLLNDTVATLLAGPQRRARAPVR